MSETTAPEIADVVAARVRARFGERLREVVEDPEGVSFGVDRADLIELATFLRDDPELQFVRLSDLTAVDYLNQPRTPRFAVVYHAYSPALKRYVRFRVRVEEDEASVPSVTGVWPGANWFEREVFDLFGIRFTGHPDLKRILLPDEWVGHPLRKDDEHPPEPIEFSFNPEQWQKAVQRGD